MVSEFLIEGINEQSKSQIKKGFICFSTKLSSFVFCKNILSINITWIENIVEAGSRSNPSWTHH